MVERKIGVLVIDDSAFNRRTIVSMLETSPLITCVGSASDGEEGLRSALLLKPDVITLDLEMPRMDGFTFLRVLMKTNPTPVIVISSYGRAQTVFKALELGALDFIVKPTQYLSPTLESIREGLVSKLLGLRTLHLENLTKSVAEPRRRVAHEKTGAGPRPVAPPGPLRPLRVIAVGASTGGPAALQRIFASLPADLPACVLVAQHMPERFTRAFADRLDRHSALTIREAAGGEPLGPGLAFIAPGGRTLRVVRSAARATLDVVARGVDDRHAPSVDALFRSAAQVIGRDLLAGVLTGMGDDGREGVRAVKEAGGATLAESEETAVVYGMPREAIETGCVDRVLPLPGILEAMQRFAAGSAIAPY